MREEILMKCCHFEEITHGRIMKDVNIDQFEHFAVVGIRESGSNWNFACSGYMEERNSNLHLFLLPSVEGLYKNPSPR